MSADACEQKKVSSNTRTVTVTIIELVVSIIVTVPVSRLYM